MTKTARKNSPWPAVFKKAAGIFYREGGVLLDFSAYRFTAHRGLYGNGVPENSLPAFLAAMEKGYAAELDVHLTADGKLAVFHDHSLKRMTGAEGRVEECGWPFLQTLRLQGTACGIPALEEVLELADGKMPLLIEAKDETLSGKLEQRLARALSSYNGPVLVESFNPYVIWWFRRNAPEIVRGQLAAGNLPELSRLKCWALRHMVFNWMTKPHFIAYNVTDMTDAFLKKCGCGRGLFAWTVRTPREYEKARRCDGLIFERFDIRKMTEQKG